MLNKIDLPSADPEQDPEIEDVIGIEAIDAVRCSAKTGEGVEDVLRSWSRAIRRRSAMNPHR